MRCTAPCYLVDKREVSLVLFYKKKLLASLPSGRGGRFRRLRYAPTRPTARCFVFKKGCNIATLSAFTTAPEPGGGGASLWQALMIKASIPFHRCVILQSWTDWRPSSRDDHKPRLCYDLSTRQPGRFTLSDGNRPPLPRHLAPRRRH
jgi:hypothetical protein